MVNPKTRSGVIVTTSTAERCIAVYGCLRILSTSFGQLPIRVYKRLKGGGKEIAEAHPVQRVLHVVPNNEETPIVFKESVAYEQARMGNAYAEIVRDGSGAPVAVHPLETERVTVKRDDSRELVYEYRVDTERAVLLRPQDVLHVKLFGFGPVGKSPITVAREAIGVDISAEEHSAAFFGSGANPSIVLTHPGRLSKPAHDRMRDDVTRKYGGPKNSGRPMILEEGTKIEKLTATQKDSQFIESRGFNVDQICRLFGVPPHMLARLDRATFSNIEHLSIEFAVYTLAPYLIRFEQECDRKLLLNDPNLFCKFNFDALLRGDVKSRNEAYSIARQWGWISADEIREREDLNPLPNGQGKVWLTPMNMIPADQVGKVEDAPKPSEPEPPADDDDDDADRSRRAFWVMLRDAARRNMAEEVKGLRTIASKAGGDFDQMAEGVRLFYQHHVTRCVETVGPVLEAFECEVPATALAEYWVGCGRTAILDAVNKRDLPKLELTLNRWPDTGANAIELWMARQWQQN